MGENRKRQQPMKQINAIDLFCGVGGLTHGLERSGINVIQGIDIDPDCQYPYENNNRSRFKLQSVADVNSDELKSVFPVEGIRLLAGCAPCQTFSRYYPKAKPDDVRWSLLGEFGDLVEDIQPELVTMENVPGLEKHRVFSQFLSLLKANSYEYFYTVVNCEEYGVPQHRKRLVLIASKYGKIRLLNPGEFGRERLCVKDVLSELPEIEAGASNSVDPIHISAQLSAINMKRIKTSKPGGTWRDWPEGLRTDCHRRDSGKTYPSVYGRMSWKNPSPTITTQFYGYGNGRFGHPEQNRAISLREGAILQSFPRNYRFIEKGKVVIRKRLGKLIGNAVPVTLGQMIGESFISHIKNIT